MMNDILKTHPAVFAVGDTYQIAISVKCNCLAWVKILHKSFGSHSSGIMISDTPCHKISVPSHLLDEAGSYTICLRKIENRTPYFPQSEDTTEITYDFYPVRKDKLNAYMLSDTHALVEEPIKSFEYYRRHYGEIDFLIINGDFSNFLACPGDLDSIYRVLSHITRGSIPVIYSRGNHDTRGCYAEKTGDFFPSRRGLPYYTFRLGDIWGMVLDCGEDKDDTSTEYGYTAHYHEFRNLETEFIKAVIANKENEYMAKDVKRRIVVCHIPFTRKFSPPFNIEEDTYSTWTELIAKHIAPHVMLCGHEHNHSVDLPGSSNDAYGMSCPVVVACDMDRQTHYYSGCGIRILDDSMEFIMNDNEKILDVYKVDIQ